VQFLRRGFQNRNKIKTKQGWQWLTVPVVHQPRSEELINGVRLDSEIPWQRKHWKALVLSYSPAPFFDVYGDGLKQLLDQEYSGLRDLDMALIRWAMEVLGIKTPVLYSSALGVEGSQTERLINICRATGADCYLSGPGGRRYMDLEAFAAAGITVTWQEFTSPAYQQVFPGTGFVPDLAVVDALFSCGPETIKLLR